LQHLVMDVKTGSGAFMANREDAVILAKSLVSVANGAGLKTTALITDMDQPLASCAGNAVEVLHAVEFLKGTLINSRVEKITLALGAELLVSSGLAATLRDAESKLKLALTSGHAAEKFARMVSQLGGPTDFMETPAVYLKAAPIVRPVFADEEGVISQIATRTLGLAVIELGGGRRRAEDQIDHSVGLSHLLGINFIVDANTPLCMVHAHDETDFELAATIVRKAYSVGENGTEVSPVLERVTA
jgi:thymidine phosphorylase